MGPTRRIAIHKQRLCCDGRECMMSTTWIAPASPIPTVNSGTDLNDNAGAIANSSSI